MNNIGQQTMVEFPPIVAEMARHAGCSGLALRLGIATL
jgi:hypothetical protein